VPAGAGRWADAAVSARRPGLAKARCGVRLRRRAPSWRPGPVRSWSTPSATLVSGRCPRRGSPGHPAPRETHSDRHRTVPTRGPTLWRPGPNPLAELAPEQLRAHVVAELNPRPAPQHRAHRGGGRGRPGRQHSAADVTVVWDLAHIGSQRSSGWSGTSAGRSRCAPENRRLYTPSSTPGPAASSCRCSPPAETRA